MGQVVSAADIPRVAVLDVSSEAWPAGRVFTSVVARSLADAAPPDQLRLELVARRPVIDDAVQQRWRLDPVLLEERDDQQPAKRGIAGAFHSIRRRRKVRRVLQIAGFPDPSDPVLTARKRGADLMLPVMDPFGLGSDAAIGWIPDFQHIHLPQFFDDRERSGRNAVFGRVARDCRLVMLSSAAALDDYCNAFPSFAAKGRVARFPSSLVFEELPDRPEKTPGKFRLPQRFALTVNQFWQHKNHLLVVEAIRLARERGVRIPFVMAGTPADYRDPRNSTVSRVLQAIACAELNDQVWLLGEVTREDLVNLLRCAAVVVQPSLSEGWSTTVQDAVALDRPLLCSNIRTLEEQAPDALGFFDVNNAAELADHLIRIWRDLPMGPSPNEEVALAQQAEFAARYGSTLLALCEEALGRSLRGSGGA